MADTLVDVLIAGTLLIAAAVYCIVSDMMTERRKRKAREATDA